MWFIEVVHRGYYIVVAIGVDVSHQRSFVCLFIGDLVSVGRIAFKIDAVKIFNLSRFDMVREKFLVFFRRQFFPFCSCGNQIVAGKI